MDFGCSRILNHRPADGGEVLGSSPHAQRTHTPSLIRYPATAERTAHLVLPFSFLVFGVLQCTIVDYFLADLDSGRLHRINISVTHFCLS